jgi:hypothetical protein
MKFHGNSDENPDQVKKPIHGNIDENPALFKKKNMKNNGNMEKFHGIICPYVVVTP